MTSQDDKEPRQPGVTLPEPPSAARAFLQTFNLLKSVQSEQQTAKTVLPGFSANGRVSILLYVGALIPVTFMILKASDVSLAPEWVGNKLIDGISFVWPVAAANYALIKGSFSETLATNYAVFMTTMFLFFVIAAAVALREFFSSTKPVSPGLAVGLLALSPIAAWFGHYMSAIEPVRRGRRSFYVDDIGFFYFYQYMFLALGFCAVALVLYVLTSAYRRFRPSPG